MFLGNTSVSLFFVFVAITPSMSADSATDSTSLSSGELSIELKEANEEDEWSMLDDIMSYMEEKDEFREITELLVCVF